MALAEFPYMLALLNSPAVWDGLFGLAAGAGLGYLCRFLVFQKRRSSLKLYVSLWEWARHRDQAGDGADAQPLPPKVRNSHAHRIQQYYRQMRRYAQAERQLVQAIFHLAFAALAVCLAIASIGRDAVQAAFWLGAMPVFLLTSCLTFFRPWLARAIALILIAGSIAMAWSIGSMQPLPRNGNADLARIVFEGDPGLDAGARVVLEDTQARKIGELSWQAPWDGISVQLELCRYRLPIDLFVSQQAAWRIAGLVRDPDGLLAGSGRQHPALPFMRWDSINSAAVSEKNLAGAHFDLNLRIGAVPVLYVNGPIADN